MLHANGNRKKACITILISNKVDFKIKTITREKDCYITIKGSLQQEGRIHLNIYIPYIRTP